MRRLLTYGLVVLALLLAAAPGLASVSGFTGAWVATDPDDQSTLKVQIGAPNASGIVRVTFVDQFASACGAPATAIGAGAITGSTLSASVKVRCGGEILAEDATFTFDLVDGVLVGGGIEYTRSGSG